MGFKAFRRASVCLTTALVIGGAWAFHVVSAAHEAGDNDCQVCSVSCAPELNADCGSVLLASPENFARLEQAALPEPSVLEFSPAFRGRAPPAA